MKQLVVGKSVTFTENDLKAALRPILIQAAKDNIESIVDGIEPPNSIITFSRLEFDELIEYWCDCCSKKFFEDHPYCDDVLVIKEILSDGTVIKEWIGSRSCVERD